jgi:hypothetical protein
VEETDLEPEDLYTEQEDNDENDNSSQLDTSLQRVSSYFNTVSASERQRHNSNHSHSKPKPPRKRRPSLVASQSVVSAVSATSVVDEFWADQLTSDFFNDDDTSSAVNAAATAEEEEEEEEEEAFNTTTPLPLVSNATDDDCPPFGLQSLVVPERRRR